MSFFDKCYASAYDGFRPGHSTETAVLRVMSDLLEAVDSGDVAVPGRSQLRSADDKKLFVPRTRTVTFGPRAFYCAGPSAWNDLPSSLRHHQLSLAVFRQKLKTALFLNELV